MIAQRYSESVAHLERRRADPLERERRLEKLLADANRQLLDRDLAVFEIVAARDEELARANERLGCAELELARHAREVEALNRALADVQASRAWRLAARYRSLRDRVRTALSG